MARPLYLDYLATTPVDPRVVERMVAHLGPEGCFGNPASRSHRYGWEAEMAVEQARRQVAELINADPREIVWTSGATESDNLALQGVARAWAPGDCHLVTAATEHSAVLDCVRFLERQGWPVTVVAPLGDGRIDPAAVRAAMRPETRLVSVMHANNEIGVLNPIAEIAGAVHDAGALLHVDAAQSVGKVPVDVRALGVDLLSISGHKLYGPKGVGALFVRRRPRVLLQPQIHGGGHERGMRSGTLATHQLVGLGAAAELAGEALGSEPARLAALRERFLGELEGLPGVRLNGHPTERLPGVANLSVAGVDGETLLLALKDLALSTGSACNSASLEPSHVLLAIGVPRELALSSLRFSFGRFSGDDDAVTAAACLRDAVHRLRAA